MPSQQRTPAEDADLLLGADAIAAFLGIAPRQVYRIRQRRELPIFKLRRKMAARRSTLVAVLARKEREASVPAPQPA